MMGSKGRMVGIKFGSWENEMDYVKWCTRWLLGAKRRVQVKTHPGRQDIKNPLLCFDLLAWGYATAICPHYDHVSPYYNVTRVTI